MGVLYAKVDGNWVPILNSTGQFLPLAGGTLTGPLNMDGAAPVGSAISYLLDGTPIGKLLGFGAAAPYDFVVQALTNNLALQGSRAVVIDGNGKRSGEFKDAILWIGDLTNVANNSASPLRLYGSSTQDYISFYHGAAPTTRSGYMGMDAATGMIVRNELAGGLLSVYSNGDVRIVTNNSENTRFTGAWLLMNKTANDQAATGFQIKGAADDCNACITNNVVNTPMFAFNKVGAGVGAGHDFLHFRNNATTIGSVTRNAQTAAVLYNTTSDYRLKDDIGPITGARERIKVLKPRRVVWKDDPTQAEVDGFLAHQVAEVVPDAVTGEKDGVDDNGNIKAQQMDATRLIPLLVAAVQELTTEVEQLRAEVALLKGAA